MNNFFLGWALCATLIAFFFGFLLFKKPSVVNHIDKMKGVFKRNKGSNIESDITPTINTETPKNERKRRLFRRKNKKQ